MPWFGAEWNGIGVDANPRRGVRGNDLEQLLDRRVRIINVAVLGLERRTECATHPHPADKSNLDVNLNFVARPVYDVLNERL